MNTISSELRFEIIPVTAFEQNCSLIWCTQTMKGALIDPGGETDRLCSAVRQHKIDLQKILVTHGHLDHASGVRHLQQKLALPVEGPHIEDKFWIDQLPQVTAEYGFPNAQPFTPERWLEHGDVVHVGNLKLEVLHCPGHTPGHIVFFHRESRTAWVGDVLFRGSMGRTDFPRGNREKLINAIRERLFTLGDDIRFIPGHGPISTFAYERAHNPYVSDQAVGVK